MIKAFKERIGWEKLSYPVPSHANTLGYSLGGITLIGFCILIISGIILAQFYNPSPGEANRSLHYIAEKVYLGWFVRGLHFWSMQLVTVCIVLHLIRTFVTAAFKKPREVNWVSGIILLAITGGFIFTGSVLKWDQEAYEALEHNLWAAKKLGPLGFLLTNEFTDSVSMLGRLYGVHTSLLPLIFLPLLSLHLLLQKLHGLSDKPVEENNYTKMIPFTDHIKHLSIYGIGVLAFVSTLALFIVPPLGDSPVIGIEVTKPPWMFLWIYALENIWVPFLIVAPPVLFAILLIIPFLETSDAIVPSQRKIPILIFYLSLASLLGLIIVGLVSTGGHSM